jgi:hypothetical protein
MRSLPCSNNSWTQPKTALPMLMGSEDLYLLSFWKTGLVDFSKEDAGGHVKLVHCHHGMARPRVADKGDGLQIWRVAANTLNKQLRTADCGWFSNLGVGVTTSPP